MATSIDFRKKVAAKSGATQDTVKTVLDAAEVVLKELVSEGESDFKVIDLMVKLHNVPERSGVNGLTKQKYVSPAHSKIFFKASRNLKAIARATHVKPKDKKESDSN